MNKQTVTLIGVALVLATLYIAFFTDFLKTKDIHIFEMPSPASGAIMFHLDKPIALTSVKVVATADAKTNKYPHALWHLVASSPTAPTDTIRYGTPVPGMKSEVASATPEPLAPGTDYTVQIEAAGKIKGEKPFTIH